MKFLSEVTKPFWDDVISKSPYATYFHTYNWAKLISHSIPDCTICTKGFILDDGTNVILPLIGRSLKNNEKKYTSIEPGVYGGVLTNGRPIMLEESVEIFMNIRNVDVSLSYIFGNPYHDFFVPSNFVKKQLITHIIKLDGSYDRVWNSYQYSARKQVRKAKRLNAKSLIADSMDGYIQYFKIYQIALKRWKNNAQMGYQFSLFENIFALNDPNVKLWLVTVKDEIKGGIIVLYCKSHAVAWHAAFDHHCFPFGISNYLYNEIIFHASENGYKIFDFNPSDGLEGVERYKETFGSERHYFNIYYWPSTIFQKLRHRIRKKFNK